MTVRPRTFAAAAAGVLVAGGLLAAPLSSTAAAAGTVTYSYTSSEAASVDDSSATRSVTVGEDVEVSDVDVTIEAAKSFGGCPAVSGIGNLPAEIYYRLTSPAGTTVRLVRTYSSLESDNIGPTYRNQGPDGNYDADFAVQTITYDDEAADPAGPVWGSGTFRPAESLSAFDGQSSAGTWSLTVGDSIGGQWLCHQSFELAITTPDITAPGVSITAGPADGDTVKTAPTYEFTSDEDGSTFQCAVDDGDFTDCDSPYTVDITELPDGDHTFSVRATDAADNTSEVASRDFTLDAIDTDAPVTTIDSGPDDGASVETAPTFGFSSTADDVDRFECSLDGVTYTTCTSPFDTDVEPGTYTFSVRAVDATDNVGDAVSRTFTLRDIACEDATAVFQSAKADVRAAKDRLAAARESGNPKRIERSKERLADAKDVKNDAKADVAEECGTSLTALQ